MAKDVCECLELGSHPTRVRGLKLVHLVTVDLVAGGSHPTRVRGLKLDLLDNMIRRPYVAPHAGAWIETQRFFDNFIGIFRRTPRGCVD